MEVALALLLVNANFELLFYVFTHSWYFLKKIYLYIYFNLLWWLLVNYRKYLSLVIFITIKVLYKVYYQINDIRENVLWKKEYESYPQAWCHSLIYIKCNNNNSCEDCSLQRSFTNKGVLSTFSVLHFTSKEKYRNIQNIVNSLAKNN